MDRESPHDGISIHGQAHRSGQPQLRRVQLPYQGCPHRAPRLVTLLVCRLAYVSPGLAVPLLPLNEATENYIERWFPRKFRSSAPFQGIQYVQVSHPNPYYREWNHPITVRPRFVLMCLCSGRLRVQEAGRVA